MPVGSNGASGGEGHHEEDRMVSRHRDDPKRSRRLVLVATPKRAERLPRSRMLAGKLYL